MLADGPVVETVRAWTAYELIPDGVRLHCRTAAGNEAEVRVTCPLEAVLRLEMAPGRLAKRTSEMLAMPRSAPCEVQVEPGDGELVLRTPALAAHIAREPWRLHVEGAGGEELWAEPAAGRPGNGAARGLGWERRGGGRLAMRESYALAAEEALFGLGEQPGPLNRRGRTIHCAVSTERTPQAVPFLWSTRGYGLFVHSYGSATFALGSRSPAACTVTVEDEQLDCFVIAGPAPADILRRYAELTGFASPPPPWAFGFWVAEPRPGGRQAVEETCASLRSRLIPCEAVHVEDAALGNPALAFDRTRHRQIARLADDLHSIGFHLSLAVSPYLLQGSPLYAEALRRSLFVRDGDGQVLLCRRGASAQALVDLTLPAARVWWQRRLHRLFAAGTDAVLINDGADAPLDGVYHDGTPGLHMRNRYPLLCQAAVCEAAARKPVWALGAWAGSQRTAIPWRPGVAAAGAAGLRAGLGLGLSGIPFWAHDTAGQSEANDPTLFVRSCQLALLSACARLQGSAAAEFAALGRVLEEIIREFARLRLRLLPYIYSSAVAGAAAGLPLMRPLVLSHPSDRNTWSLDGEYLLGEHILIAPVWEAPANVDVYLPEGQWIDYWTGATYQGPAWVRSRAPLDRQPILMRAGAIIPTRPPAHYAGERPDDPIVLEVYPQTSGRFVMHREDGSAHVLEMEAGPGRLALHVPPLGVQVEAVLHGVPPPAQAALDGRAVECAWSGGLARVSLDEGGLLTYQTEPKPARPQ